MKLLRSILKFIRDSLDALVTDEYDLRARKEADDKSRKWLSYLGSGGR